MFLSLKQYQIKQRITSSLITSWSGTGPFNCNRACVLILNRTPAKINLSLTLHDIKFWFLKKISFCFFVAPFLTFEIAGQKINGSALKEAEKFSLRSSIRYQLLEFSSAVKNDLFAQHLNSHELYLHLLSCEIKTGKVVKKIH